MTVFWKRLLSILTRAVMAFPLMTQKLRFTMRKWATGPEPNQPVGSSDFFKVSRVFLLEKGVGIFSASYATRNEWIERIAVHEKQLTIQYSEHDLKHWHF